MLLNDITNLLQAKVYTSPHEATITVDEAFASDLMSDVLTLKGTPLLITSTCNPQTIRASYMVNLPAVVIVGGKQPQPEMVEEAQSNDIALLSTQLSMFQTCALLCNAGLKSTV